MSKIQLKTYSIELEGNKNVISCKSSIWLNYEFQHGRSIYEINKVNVFDSEQKKVLVSFTTSLFADDDKNGLGISYRTIEFPNELKMKRKIDLSLNKSFLVSNGRDYNWNSLEAEVYIPVIELNDFHLRYEDEETELGRFQKTIVQFDNLEFIANIQIFEELEKLKNNGKRQIEKVKLILKEIERKIDNAQNIDDLNELYNDKLPDFIDVRRTWDF